MLYVITLPKTIRLFYFKFLFLITNSWICYGAILWNINWFSISYRMGLYHSLMSFSMITLARYHDPMINLSTCKAVRRWPGAMLPLTIHSNSLSNIKIVDKQFEPSKSHSSCFSPHYQQPTYWCRSSSSWYSTMSTHTYIHESYLVVLLCLIRCLQWLIWNVLVWLWRGDFVAALSWYCCGRAIFASLRVMTGNIVPAGTSFSRTCQW